MFDRLTESCEIDDEFEAFEFVVHCACFCEILAACIVLRPENWVNHFSLKKANEIESVESQVSW